MHAAMHSWSFRNRFQEDESFTIFQALDETSEMGFASMEVMTGKANCSPSHIGTDTVAGLEQVLAHAKSVGIEIHCYSTYNDFAYVKDEAWRLANVEYIKTWLRLAGETGVPNIRMLTGYYQEDEDKTRLEDLTRKGIEECIPVAEEAGVNMAIENHNSIFFTGPEIESLIESFGSERLTTCPDPSNGYAQFFDDDCPADQREAAYENLAILAPRATNAHLKIKGLGTDDEPRGWDLDRLVRVYREAGYDGPLTFESIGEGDLIAPLARARECVEAAIARAGSCART